MKQSQHGTLNGYIYHKCRCDHCRIRWNSYQTERRNKRTSGELPTLVHGKSGSYAAGCRCDLCKVAHADIARERTRIRKISNGGEYVRLYKKQDGKCAICERSDMNLVPDHEHGTNVIRGLLCNTCNTGLGKLGDSVDGLQRALAYLESK